MLERSVILEGSKEMKWAILNVEDRQSGACVRLKVCYVFGLLLHNNCDLFPSVLNDSMQNLGQALYILSSRQKFISEGIFVLPLPSLYCYTMSDPLSLLKVVFEMEVRNIW